MKMESDFFLAAFSKIQGAISHFSKLAYKPSQKQMPIPPFWGYFGVEKWPTKFCLGIQNANFCSQKLAFLSKVPIFMRSKMSF